MNKRWGMGGAVLGIGLLLTAGAFPADAVPPNVTISSPAEDATVKTNPVIAGSASMPNNGTVNGGTVTVTPANPDHGPEQAQAFPGGDRGQVVQFSLTFDFAWNGVYTARAQATGTDGGFVDTNGPETSAPVSRTFKLEKPPVAPTGLETVVNEEKRTVTITWDANPEPDILGYCISYVYNGKSNALSPCQAETEKVHTLGSNNPAGEYEYRVIAVRKDADGSGGIAGPAASEKAKVSTSPTVALSGGAPPTTSRSTTGSTTRSGSSSSGSSTPRPGGRVSLDDFGSLLGDRSELPLPPRVRGSSEVDTGFENELPFGSPRTSIVTGEEAAEELNGTPASSGDDKPQELLFLAAGLLVTVILMHVLWIKSEVDRVPLEAVAPDGGGVGDRHEAFAPEDDAEVVDLRRARRTAA